ncbi:MAG TPA: cyclic nucleotide-binding domain-containing protein, partial [Polyangiaceae bacterium]|nr:cyclic nucleotide-binding domain-containing protein [Polyangiaceae bacterium]
AVGVYEHAEVDTLRVDILPNDQFLLSSDGLTTYFFDPAEDIVNLLAEKDGERTVRALIDFANERGGKDNITVMLVRFGSGDVADTARARRVQLKREVLAQLPLFARLNDRELLRMMQVAEVHLYDKGDVVMAEGERGDHMFVMLQGRLQVTRGGKVIGELKSGEQLGEMALIRSTPRSATVTALEDSELISLNRRDFFDIIRIEPHLAVKLLWQFLGVLADRLEEANRHLTEDHVLPSTEEIMPSQPPLDSEDRPTPVPDDPFAQPSFSIGRLPLSVAQAMPEGALVLDTSGAHRIEDSPSFDDAPEIAQRLVPAWQQGVTIDDSPSWDSWDQVGENDPETRRRHETPVDAPQEAPQGAPQVAPQGTPREPKKTRPEIERPRAKTRPWKVPSPEGFSKSDGPTPSRPRHKTLQSAGSVPPNAPSSDVPPSGDQDDAPVIGRRPLKGTMPDGRLRAAREEALIHASTIPLPQGEETNEEKEFRPTKQTIPMQPDETLKQELEALRAEFKQRLEKSRRERGQKDSD